MSIVSPDLDFGSNGSGGLNGRHAGGLVPEEPRLIDGVMFYRLPHVDQMPPFFMSLLSSEDHWMFVTSGGAISCGRGSAEGSLFPYYSSDKLIDLQRSTGVMTVFHVRSKGRTIRWEPFRGRDSGASVERHLFKNRLGTRVIFEECNPSLGLVFRYQWSMSRRFGFIRTAHLHNVDRRDKLVEVLDGFMNIVPGEVDPQFQLRYSNLLDAYKKSELVMPQGIGVFYLSSVPTDRAEPSEGLLASVAWATGLDRPTILLSDRQIERFRDGSAVETEVDVRGHKGHFLVSSSFLVPGHGQRSWKTVADVRRDACDLVSLRHTLEIGEIDELIDEDVEQGEADLARYASEADGEQVCRQERRAGRHLSNVLFNIMRGGVPLAGYQVEKTGFIDHLCTRSRSVYARHAGAISALPEKTSVGELVALGGAVGDADLRRITAEFLPLTLSRRHGDPTRPWNRFHISARTSKGSRRVGFEGNWRDIFQNWEALGFSYPDLLPAMILRFVNSSTADGYNPYRILDSGFEWERPEAEDAWSNYGYWGDHQLVYLWRLFDLAQAAVPDRLAALLADESICVYADVPYRIRGFQALMREPRSTIAYDHEADRAICQRVASMGTDGQLVQDRQGRIHRASLLEKLLLPGLVKIANFVPGAGVWLNTQRPEWNDAQNALAGLGASLVTTSYLRRYLAFLDELLESWPADQVQLSAEVGDFVLAIMQALSADGRQRRGESAERWRYRLVEQLQLAAEAHRRAVYEGFCGVRSEVSIDQVRTLLAQGAALVTETLRESKRPDGLYHSFHVLQFGEQEITVEPLEEMLEGQVAMLESGMLTPTEVSHLLAALRESALYRPDQTSYLLYPDRQLQRFEEKNRIPGNRARGSQTVMRLIQCGQDSLLRQDSMGDVHFAGVLRNIDDLNDAIDRWNTSHPAEALGAEERAELGVLWEETFHHHGFIGRATRFFGYEGLGSVYWHMVSKAACAAARQCVVAHGMGDSAFEPLLDQFRELNEGMWLSKSPACYGAFPTDPYSHTPAHAGAQQPGMTGQVKEDILTRFLELGVRVDNGCVSFVPCMLREEEFLETAGELRFFSIAGTQEIVAVPAGGLAFTLCQVPVLYHRSGTGPKMRVHFHNGKMRGRDQAALTAAESRALFGRTGEIARIDITVENLS